MSTTETVPAPAPEGGRRSAPRGAGWLLVALGALLALLGVVAGATALVGPLLSARTTGGEVVQGVSEVEVVNDCAGDVDVRAGGTGGTGAVEVAWRDRSAVRSPQHRQELTGSALRVEVDCPAVTLGWGPTSDLSLTVPAGAPVTVRAGSGDVTASGLAARSELETGSGDVRVEDTAGGLTLVTGSGTVRADGVSGDLLARTGSGDVVGTGLAGGRVDVETGSGDVALESVRDPGPVAARAGSGDLEVVLPDDGQPYAVDATSDSGEVAVEVPDDPAAGRPVALATGSGDITVRHDG